MKNVWRKSTTQRMVKGLTKVAASTIMLFTVGFTASAEGLPNAPWKEEVSTPGGTNVGDGRAYDYIITDVHNGEHGVEIHGFPLTRLSEGNRGIFLYQSEVSFEVEVGDRISVVWGEEEDEFASIDRITQGIGGCAE